MRTSSLRSHIQIAERWPESPPREACLATEATSEGPRESEAAPGGE